MLRWFRICRCCSVALLTEGVDRNKLVSAIGFALLSSPSSRRAWIEIPGLEPQRVQDPVALLTEGVDRNFDDTVFRANASGRPPHGGRG